MDILVDDDILILEVLEEEQILHNINNIIVIILEG